MSLPAEPSAPSTGPAGASKQSTARFICLVAPAAAVAAMVGTAPRALKLGSGPALPGAIQLATPGRCAHVRSRRVASR